MGICGSHRKGQNSYRMLKEAMTGVKEEEPAAETKIIELAGLNIQPCIAVCGDAGTCGKEPFKCVLKDDLQMVFDEMKLADGIMFASPRYFIVPSKLQALIERLYCVNYNTRRKNPSLSSPLKDKPFGLLTTSSSDAYSAIPLQEHLEKFCLWLQMKPVTIEKWPFRGVHGQFPVEEDLRALELARALGQNIAKIVRAK
ncbi:MAG: flavodoxin family protein [Candidatus Bathycorpusculaceae bacterium]